MKNEQLIEALNGIDEELLSEGIALAETAALCKGHQKRGRIARALILSGVAALLACALLLTVFLRQADPTAPLPPSSVDQSESNKESTPVFPDTSVPV